MPALTPQTRRTLLSLALLVWVCGGSAFFLSRERVVPLWSDAPRALPGALAGGWLAALFSPDRETALGLLQCLGLALYLLAWGGLAPRRLWPEASRLERVAAGAWLATASLAFGFMMLGSLHLLRPSAGWLWVGVHAGIGLWLARPFRASPVPLAGRQGAADGPAAGCSRPRFDLERVLCALAWSGIALLSALTFYHALFYPPTSWDALMYYLDHPRRAVAEGGFPHLVASQVGMGLAANYPPLYRSLAAGVPALFGTWNPLVGQFANPWAGLWATLLVYAWLRRRGSGELCAVAGALAFRAVPYGIFFSTSAGHYAWSMAAVAAFFWSCERALVLRIPAAQVAPLAFAALAASINYLMPGLLLPALLLCFLLRAELAVLRPGRLLAWSAGLLFICGFWYARNWIVTGNPVYPFFSAWLGGANIHPGVLASARVEWTLNGDGLAGYGPVWRRLVRIPYYLCVEPNIVWKLQPLVLAFGVPGFFLSLRAAGRLLWLSFFLLLAGYGTTLGAFYLYHLLPLFPFLGLFTATLLERATPRARLALAGLLLAIAFGPSLGAALMGPKVPDPRLSAFARPNPPRDAFLSAVPSINGSVQIWGYLSQQAPHAVVLTHENRGYYLPLSLRLLPLDDPAIWPLYETEDAEMEYRHFLALGATHYLYIRNQERHPILRRLSLGEAARGRLPQFYRLVMVAPNGDALFELR